jgi:hypothetical protein
VSGAGEVLAVGAALLVGGEGGGGGGVAVQPASAVATAKATADLPIVGTTGSSVRRSRATVLPEELGEGSPPAGVSGAGQQQSV